METPRLIFGKQEALSKALALSILFRCCYYVYFNLAGYYAIDSLQRSFSGEILEAEFERGIEKIC